MSEQILRDSDITEDLVHEFNIATICILALLTIAALVFIFCFFFVKVQNRKRAKKKGEKVKSSIKGTLIFFGIIIAVYSGFFLWRFIKYQKISDWTIEEHTIKYHETVHKGGYRTSHTYYYIGFGGKKKYDVDDDVYSSVDSGDKAYIVFDHKGDVVRAYDKSKYTYYKNSKSVEHIDYKIDMPDIYVADEPEIPDASDFFKSKTKSDD